MSRNKEKTEDAAEESPARKDEQQNALTFKRRSTRTEGGVKETSKYPWLSSEL